MSEYYAVVRSCSLSHHGIKGQKWGVRRFQNEDGSLTAEGKQRYLTSVVRFSDKRVEKAEAKYNKAREAYDADPTNRRAMKRYFRSGKRLLNAASQLTSEHVIEKQNAEKRQSKAEGKGDSYKAEQAAAVANNSARQMGKMTAIGMKATSELISRGANVTVKSTTRTAATGKSILTSVGMTVAMNTLLPVRGFVSVREAVVGSKFKVKEAKGSTPQFIDKRGGFGYRNTKTGDRLGYLK